MFFNIVIYNLLVSLYGTNVSIVTPIASGKTLSEAIVIWNGNKSDNGFPLHVICYFYHITLFWY